MKRLFLLFLAALMGLLGNNMRVLAQDVPEPIAQWNFNDAANLMTPDKGDFTLTPAILGAKSISLSTLSGSGITQADGPTDDNKAILVPATSALKVGRPEGAEALQTYTLMMDIKVTNANPYNGLFQTAENNENDGDLFTNEYKIGVASIGGYFGNIQNNTWYRVVLSYRDGKNIVYVNGQKLISANPDANDRFKILPFGFYLFCDEDGEKVDNYVAQVSFWETPLTDEQVSELGSTIPPAVTEIATAQDLIDFAEYVKEGNNDAQAVLTADIALTEPWVTPIGIDGMPYSGVFDGQGHSISGLNGTSEGKFGLFGYTKGAVVKNFNISGTLEATAAHGTGAIGWSESSNISNINSTLVINVPVAGVHHVGGVVGSAQGNNTISGCTYGGSMTVVSGNTDNFAGIVAYLGGDRVFNCSNYGSITYADLGCSAGGVAGYLNNNSSYVKGCMNLGKVVCEETEGTPTCGSAIVGRLRTHDPAKLTGNCWLEGSAYGAGRNDSGVDVLTSAYCFTYDQLSTGAVCYALNGDQSEINWYQTLGTDEQPVLDNTHEKVYMVGRLHCNGDVYESATYSNTYTEVVQDDHNIVDGFCDYCGLFVEDFFTPNADGFYEIANAKQLAWFEMKVNKGALDANAILTADIDFADLMPEDAVPEETEIEWVPIGDWGNARGTGSAAYMGHFDGQGHTIKNLNATAKQNFFGLFGVISTGANIENFTIYGTYKTVYQYMGGIAAYARDDELAIRNIHSYVNIFNTCVGGRQGGILGGAHGTMTIIEGCTYSGTLDSNDSGGGGNYGGILGYANNSTSTVIDITNCLFDGTVFNSAETPGNCTFGGIVGYANSPFATLKNCLSIGKVESPRYAQFFGALNGPNSKIINSYYQGDNVNGSGSAQVANPQDATLVTDEQLASGEIAWKLNEESFLDVAWHQTIDEDLNPLPYGDGKIVYQTKDGDYANIDPASIAAFINSVIANETEFIEETVAYQELLDEYAEEVRSWENIETYEEFIEAYKAAAELKESIMTSAANYAAYVKTCEDAANYLSENSLEGEWSDFLQVYLQDNVEPNKDYSNGSYAYIMENRLLDDAAIAAEIAFVNQMLENAIAGGVTPGTEITRLLVNPKFEDGYEGWTVEFEGGTAGVAGNLNIMPIPEAYNNKNFNASQTLNGLENGIYMMALNGLFRAGSDVTSRFYAGQLYLNDTYNYFMSPGEDVVSEADAEPGVNCLGENTSDVWYVGEEEGWVPNVREGCSVAFNAGRYQNYVAAEVTDGTLTVGTRTLGTGLDRDWMPFAGPHIYYLGTEAEASEKLSEVLDGYKARAEVILNFDTTDDAAEFNKYPNMSNALKEQLAMAVAQVGQTEDKMALINTFSDLFNQILTCRKAYITMLNAAYKLSDILGEMDAEGLVSDELYEELDNEITATQTHYNSGDVTAEEALAIADKLNNINLINLDVVDGVYQLASATDLILFSKVVNMGLNTSDAVLVNDIDMTDYVWNAPIGFWGSNQIAYKGHFDGQGHTITNFNVISTQNFYGLFGVLSTNAIVENFTIYGEVNNEANQQYMGVIGFARDENVTIRNIHSCVDFINATAGGRQGGILGCANDGQTNIDRCTYSGKFQSADAGGSGNYGGIVGYANNNAAAVVNITNCLFDGELVNTAASPGTCTFGGMVGYANSATVTIKDCLSIGTVQSPRNGQFFGAINGGNSKIYNSYYQGEYINGSGSGRTPTPQEVTSVTNEQLTSGEICYRLNGDQSVINWYQTLGTDNYPVLFGDHQTVWLSISGGYTNNEADGINEIANGEWTMGDVIYNLAGQRLGKMQKGINIVNGRKVLIK